MQLGTAGTGSALEYTSSAERLRRYQWRVLLASMFCYLFYYTGRQTFGFAIPGIQAELGLSKTTLGWVSSGLLWSYAIGQAINGNLGDKYGGRRMVPLGAVLSCATNWVVSFANGFGLLLSAWSANGLAQSMGWAPGSRVISNWWSHAERGKAYGLYTFAAGLASVVAFISATLVLQSGLDWRWIFRLPVLLMLVGAIVYWRFVRDRPSDVGFSDHLHDEPASGVHSNPTSAADVDPLAAETSLQRYLAVLSNWRFLLTSLAIGFQNMARYGLLVWVPVYFLGPEHKGSAAGPWVTIALPIGMALGAMSSGWLSDRVFASNRSRPIALFLFMAALSTGGLYLLGPSRPMAGMALLFLSGYFVYGPQAPFWALCPDLLGRHRAGTGTGVMNTFAYAFAGIGEPIVGHAIESTNNAAMVFPIVAIACVCGSLLAVAIRR